MIGVVAWLAAIAGAAAGLVLPRIIALIPDRAPVVAEDGRRAATPAADGGTGEQAGPEPRPPAATTGSPAEQSGEDAVYDAPTPYRVLAAAPRLGWYLAAATAVVWGALAAGTGWDPSLPAALIVAWLGVAMGYIDVRVHRLPDRLTYPAFGGAAVALAVAAVATGEWPAYGRAWAGAFALAGVLLLLALIRPGELGLGDVKLGLSLGLLLGWIGWDHVVLGFFLSFFAGGAYSLVLLILRRANRRTAIPFGPFLLAGTLAAVGWGDVMLDAYLG